MKWRSKCSRRVVTTVSINQNLQIGSKGLSSETSIYYVFPMEKPRLLGNILSTLCWPVASFKEWTGLPHMLVVLVPLSCSIGLTLEVFYGVKFMMNNSGEI